jgi:hypothetical protein
VVQAGDEAQAEGVDQRLVPGIAEAVEEKEGQRNLIGEIATGDPGTQKVGGLLNHRIIGRYSGLQEGVSRQRTMGGLKAAVPVHAPFEVARIVLGFLQESDGTIDGAIDLGLLLLR